MPLTPGHPPWVLALFQRLRIASRACYVTDPDALASAEAWMQRAFAEVSNLCAAKSEGVNSYIRRS